MQIRQAQKTDFPAIYELVKTAFETAKVSDGTEQDFVLALRQRPAYLPALELVAEDADGALTGHIMLSRQEIPGAESALRALMLAPLSVALPHRRQGLGGRLIQAAADGAAAEGYNAIFLIGDSAYYSRYGFVSAVEQGYRNASGVPDQYLQVRFLAPYRPQQPGGTVDLH